MISSSYVRRSGIAVDLGESATTNKSRSRETLPERSDRRLKRSATLSSSSSSSAAVTDFWSNGHEEVEEEVEEVVFSRDARTKSILSASHTDVPIDNDKSLSHHPLVSWRSRLNDAVSAAKDRASEMFTPEQALQLGEVCFCFD
jgi:hypothetical protein